jgi:hypothetical protein
MAGCVTLEYLASYRGGLPGPGSSDLTVNCGVNAMFPRSERREAPEVLHHVGDAASAEGGPGVAQRLGSDRGDSGWVSDVHPIRHQEF